MPRSSNSFPDAVELSLLRTRRHWLLAGAAPGLSLLAVPALAAPWRWAAAVAALALAAVTLIRFTRTRWRRAIWQPSGAFRLEDAVHHRVAQLGPNCYRSRNLIVLHMTDGVQNWYFPLFRGDQPDAFRRCATRLRLAGRLRGIR